MSKEAEKEQCRLIGLTLGLSDDLADDPEPEFIEYDLGLIAVSALWAVRTAVLAFEQIVTGEKLVNSLDVADFYEHVRRALEVENAQGILSESGAMSSIQDEIDGLINLVNKARRLDSGLRNNRDSG